VSYSVEGYAAAAAAAVDDAAAAAVDDAAAAAAAVNADVVVHMYRQWHQSTS